VFFEHCHEDRQTAPARADPGMPGAEFPPQWGPRSDDDRRQSCILCVIGRREYEIFPKKAITGDGSIRLIAVRDPLA